MENNDTSYIFENFTAQLWTTTDGPKSLYHYTTTEGARSIISNGKFWVSSFETMNDNQELKKGLHIAKGDLPIFLKDIAHLEFAQVIITKWQCFLDEEINNPSMRPYILCFTESSESKLHWEQYSDTFKGVAIELKHIFKLENSANGFWVKVLYDEIQARENFRINLKKVTELFLADYQSTPNLTENLARKKIKDLFHAYIQIIFRFAISLKKSKWAGEQEWRLVLFGTPDRNPQLPHGPINYRTRQSELVDYLIVDTKKCGYDISGAKTGYHFPSNSLNGFLKFLKTHSISNVK